MSTFIKQFLYDITMIIAKVHDYIMRLNDNLANPFTDKELHFIVMGTLGMFMVLITYPLFKYLSKKKYHVHYISIRCHIYVNVDIFYRDWTRSYKYWIVGF